jgi:hypothetical protein
MLPAMIGYKFVWQCIDGAYLPENFSHAVAYAIDIGCGWALRDNASMKHDFTDHRPYLPGVHAFTKVSEEMVEVFQRYRFDLVPVKVLLRGPICGGLELVGRNYHHVVVYREMTILGRERV